MQKLIKINKNDLYDIYTDKKQDKKLKKKGEMAEWLKAPAWKACILLKVSRVRIPFSPPIIR